eukprot:superscaffoldBa00009639_g24218
MGTIRRRLLLLLSLLLHLNPSLTYSLKSCNIDYSEDPSADVVLDCSNGELVVIPDDIPRDVSSVNLRNNTIGRINREDFGFLSKLRLLSLDLNEIADIDDGSFIGLVALTKLRMRFNNLTNLTSNLFQGLFNLTTLDVGNNNIQFIDTSAFRFLSRLQTVKLDSNRLRQVSDIQPILQLPHLRELIIGDNQFHSFQTKDLLLNMSSSLQMLDVARNELEKFSITTPIFPRLELVDISRCGHNASLEWDIPDKTLLRNITQLYFSYISLPFKEMQNVLQSLDSLMHLRLNHMREYINKGLLKTVCKIPTLKKLDLSHNQCPNISAKLVSCSQLTELDLSITYMTELSQGSIRSMKQLKNLAVQGNFLSKVPDDISGLSSLEILDLSNNLLTELVCGDFLNTTRLTELYLNTNHIAKLDGCVFENMNDLKVLDLSKPIIENITDAIYSSRKTICVISQRYLQSEWCSREIQMASFRLFDEQKDVLILLFLEEIPAYQLSPFYRMRKLVKRHTYLSWSQAGQHTGVFWQNVRRALETRDAPTENTNLLTGPAGSFHQPEAP